MIKIKPFWIRKTSIGYKKIIFLFLILISGFMIKSFWSFPEEKWFIFQIISVILLGILIGLSIRNGITILQARIVLKDKILTVEDDIFPLYPQLSRRGIVDLQDSILWSAFYLQRRESWFLLDCIRKIIEKNMPKEKTALVLGGGGAALPLSLLETFNIQSDVVELLPELISAAEIYFIPLRIKTITKKFNQLRFIKGDGVKYLAKSKKKYGIVVVDLFQGNSPLSSIKSTPFLKKLKKSGNIILVNFGVHNVNQNLQKNLPLYIRKYQKIFRYGYVYSSGSNYIGVFSEKQRIVGEIGEQRIY